MKSYYKDEERNIEQKKKNWLLSIITWMINPVYCCIWLKMKEEEEKKEKKQ